MDENTKRLVDILQSAGHEPYAYSGRGMYGKECVGVDIDRGGSLGFAAEVLTSLLDDGFDIEVDGDVIAKAFAGAQSDGMGVGIVVYFPHYRVTSDDLPRGH